MGTADGPEEEVGVNAVRPAPPFALGWALAVVVEAPHDVASTTVVCCAVRTTRGTHPEAFDATAPRGSRSAQKSLLLFFKIWGYFGTLRPPRAGGIAPM